MPKLKTKRHPKTKWLRIRVREEDFKILQKLIIDKHGEYVLNFYAYEVIAYAAKDLQTYFKTKKGKK